MSEDRDAESVAPRHYADLYHEDNGVIPTCQCGWEMPRVPTYDEAAEAYAQHRLLVAQIDRSEDGA